MLAYTPIFASTTVELIDPRAPDEPVVACAPEEQIIAQSSEQ